MIGQKYLVKKLKNQKLMTLTLLVGSKGSGKKTLLKELFPDAIFNDNIGVDDIRKVIELAYKLSNQVFIIPDADDMSNNAKNSLLKLVEEGKNGNKFIITLQDEFNTLDTIRSRGVIYHMDNYTRQELVDYLNKYYQLTAPKEEHDICLSICVVPGEIDLLMSMNPITFYEYVELVVDNIDMVSGANSFKISNEIALKNEEDKYDLIMFWKAFIRVCFLKKDKKYLQWVKITSYYLTKLRIKGINKGMLFDNWLLEIRQVGIENES